MDKQDPKVPNLIETPRISQSLYTRLDRPDPKVLNLVETVRNFVSHTNELDNKQRELSNQLNKIKVNIQSTESTNKYRTPFNKMTDLKHSLEEIVLFDQDFKDMCKQVNSYSIEYQDLVNKLALYDIKDNIITNTRKNIKIQHPYTIILENTELGTLLPFGSDNEYDLRQEYKIIYTRNTTLTIVSVKTYIDSVNKLNQIKLKIAEDSKQTVLNDKLRVITNMYNRFRNIMD